MAAPPIEFDPSDEPPKLLSAVRDYWFAKRGAGDMPRRADILPSELKPYLPNILLADVVDGGRDFRYRLVGRHLQPSFAANPTGKLMSEVLEPFGAETVRNTIAAYSAVIVRRAPLRMRADGSYFAQGWKIVEAILAPLSDDGIDVNMIFGTFQFVWTKPLREAIRNGDAEAREMERVLAASA